MLGGQWASFLRTVSLAARRSPSMTKVGFSYDGGTVSACSDDCGFEKVTSPTLKDRISDPRLDVFAELLKGKSALVWCYGIGFLFLLLIFVVCLLISLISMRPGQPDMPPKAWVLFIGSGILFMGVLGIVVAMLFERRARIARVHQEVMIQNREFVVNQNGMRWRFVYGGSARKPTVLYLTVEPAGTPVEDSASIEERQTVIGD